MPDDMREAETENYRLLLVDDDAGWCVRPIAKLRANGFEVEYEEMAENTLIKIRAFNPHAVLLDVLFGNENKGKPTFRKIKEKYPDLPVIMLTSTLKDSFNLKDYPGCAFPFAKDQLNTGGDKEREKKVYAEFAEKIRKAINKKTIIADFVVGHTMAMKNVGEKILEVAPTPSTVLILGESGAGKELIANAIHHNSLRSGRPFVKVNCAALSEDVIESELFGHVKGAFTGAIADKPGRFELANGGTLFLDEIGDITLHTQVKLLRVLQEGEFERVGGTKTIKVDVRIITATNKDIPSLIKNGKFREDLYYRLNVFPISVPPLRERKEDIPDLLAFFISRFNQELNKSVLIETESGKRDYLRPDVLEILRKHDWQGNIRELEHVVERAMIKAGDSNVLLPEHFDLSEKVDEASGFNEDKAVSEVFSGKWKGEKKWQEFTRTYPKTGGTLRKIMMECIKRRKNDLKKNLKHQDMADLFGIKEGNMRKWITIELEIDWDKEKRYPK